MESTTLFSSMFTSYAFTQTIIHSEKTLFGCVCLSSSKNAYVALPIILDVASDYAYRNEVQSTYKANQLGHNRSMGWIAEKLTY